VDYLAIPQETSASGGCYVITDLYQYPKQKRCTSHSSPGSKGFNGAL
jgi:hypothetical protein